MSRTQEKIRRVQVAIENDLARPWKAEDLARLVSLSPSHLRQLFKDETGKTSLQDLKRIRLHAAFKLLTIGLLSVKEVMHRVGMNNHSHFVKDFKKLFGSVPSKVKRLDRDSDQHPGILDRR
jgi:AraC-like DNA-binding protein